MTLTARKVPYSSIVGASLMLHDDAGRVVGQLAIVGVGGAGDDYRARSEAVAEQVVRAFEARAEIAKMQTALDRVSNRLARLYQTAGVALIPDKDDPSPVPVTAEDVLDEVLAISAGVDRISDRAQRDGAAAADAKPEPDWRTRARELSRTAWDAVTQAPDFAGVVAPESLAGIALTMAEHLGKAGEEIDIMKAKLAPPSDKARADMVKHLGEDSSTVEAFDVFAALCRARQYGLEVEWFETFLADLKAGKVPREAAVGSCHEWDV